MTKRPADCMHDNLLEGTTVMRCLDCGEAFGRPTVAEAIAACRAILRRPDREEDPA